MNRVSRVGFLRGDFRGAKTPNRPPWALVETVFVERCSRCDACIPACPEHILVRGRAGFPEVDFSRGGCTFCAECVTACTAGALCMPDPEAASGTAWPIRAFIQPGCLAHKSVECRVCGEHCEARAIRFYPAVGTVAAPSVDFAVCNGCGACVSACPVEAVVVQSAPTETVVRYADSKRGAGL